MLALLRLSGAQLELPNAKFANEKYHHLIPRSTHHKVLKKGCHPETMPNSVAWLCRCVTSTSCIVGILIPIQALSFYCSWGRNK